MSEKRLDLLVVGAGPTGIAIGAEARRAGLDAIVIDRGPLCAAIVDFPINMLFFTTRDLLEIADTPFGIPDDKPTRRQALSYYQGVVRRYQIPLALYEDVVEVAPAGSGSDGFVVTSRKAGEERVRRARAVALATGYFDHPKRLAVVGEDLPWVHSRYREPYLHFGQHVAVIGGGNSATEAALDMWRNGVRVTLIHRGAEVKRTVKYWVKPDIENRIAEGSIVAFFNTQVKSFSAAAIEIEQDGRRRHLSVDAAYVLIGYLPDVDFERRCGIEVDAETLVPIFDPATCETNVPGLYIAGTPQAGHDTGRIFIENSREHAPKIVHHILGHRPVSVD